MAQQDMQVAFQLTNVNLDAFKALLSSSLLCDSKLGFTMEPSGRITSLAMAGGASFYKKWSAELSQFCERFVASVQQPIKVFFLDGAKFKNKVLSFGTADMTFYCRDIQGQLVTQKIVIEAGPIKLNVACSPLSLGFVELTQAQHNAIFCNTNNVRKLELEAQHLKALKYYGSLNTSGKIQDNIELKTTDKGLVATDSSFEFVINPNYGFDLQPIRLHKSLLGFIDQDEDYDIRISTMLSGRDVMTLQSKQRDLIMTVSLVDDVDSYVGCDDGDVDELPF